MRKKEGFFEGIVLPATLILKMLIPPFNSLRRLEKACKAWLRRNPEASFPMSFLADLYRFYEKNEEAKQEYMKLKHLGSMSDSDRLGLGEVLFRLEDYHGVIENASPILDKYPKRKNANWYLGRSYMKIGEYQKAAIYMENVILAGSKRYEDYWHLGDCYHYTGQFKKAREQYSKALSLNPGSQELKENIASIDSKLQQGE